jgi:hypothetical protein
VKNWQARLAHYVLSLPERTLRSASALAGGLLREVGEAALPAAVRRTRLYQSMVEATLRFLIEQVGQVEGAYPAGGRLATDFLARRAAGNGIEFLGILTFRASPVWILAALADLSGAGRHLIGEIATQLRLEGLLAADAHPETMDQMLDSLQCAAGRTAEAINTPPLDVAALRQEWEGIRASFASVPGPAIDALERQWSDLEATARRENRSVFELSAVMALTALTRLPEGVVWLARSARAAARATGDSVARNLLAHYANTLGEIRAAGFAAWWSREFRPYLQAAASQFSPDRPTTTSRFISGTREG